MYCVNDLGGGEKKKDSMVNPLLLKDMKIIPRTGIIADSFHYIFYIERDTLISKSDELFWYIESKEKYILGMEVGK